MTLQEAQESYRIAGKGERVRELKRLQETVLRDLKEYVKEKREAKLGRNH